jgi:hypothetical protein
MADDNPGNIALLEGIRTVAETLANAHRPPRKIRAPRFAEQRDVGEYLQDFERIAELNGWDDAEAGIELQSVLEGRALTLALSARTASFHEICEILRERLVLRPDQAREALNDLRLTKEEIDETANQVRRLTVRGYGHGGFDLRPDLLRQEQVCAFLRAIKLKEVRHWVHNKDPRTLDEAIAYVKSYYLLDEQYAPPKRVRNVEADSSSDLVATVQQLTAEIKKLREAPTTPVKEVRCKICQGHHYATGCPNKRKQPAENYQGPR